jgi:hypothetical protein
MTTVSLGMLTPVNTPAMNQATRPASENRFALCSNLPTYRPTFKSELDDEGPLVLPASTSRE